MYFLGNCCYIYDKVKKNFISDIITLNKCLVYTYTLFWKNLFSENARMPSNGYLILQIYCLLLLHSALADNRQDDFRFIPFQGKGHIRIEGIVPISFLNWNDYSLLLLRTSLDLSISFNSMCCALFIAGWITTISWRMMNVHSAMTSR